MSKVTVKQEPGSSNCVAVTACNAFGCSVSEFEALIGKCPPAGYSDLDFYRFALYKGYILGVACDMKGTKLKGVGIIAVEVPTTGQPAYVVVKSRNYPGKSHAIYWDGEKVHDPDPGIEDSGLPLGEYEVLLFMPIFKLTPGADMV